MRDYEQKVTVGGGVNTEPDMKSLNYLSKHS